MKTFNRDNKSGDRRGGKEFGRRDSGGRNYGGGKPSMHKAICSDCGKECEVPFRPTGDRPIFCSSCFGKRGSMSLSRPGARSYIEHKRMFKAVCDKCGNKCEVPFRPTGGKPVYCSQCFDKGGSSGGKDTDQYKEQFEMLNAKLDKILKVLNTVPADISAGIEAIQEEGVIKKTEKTKKHKDDLIKTKAVSKKTRSNK